MCGCPLLRSGVLRMVMRAVFFSSRRRHTRYWRDWSSDVCSSDLNLRAHSGLFEEWLEDACEHARGYLVFESLGNIALIGFVGRSEERRVGKECRSRWSPYP